MELSILLLLSMVALLIGAGFGLLLKGRGWGLAALKGLVASFLGGLLLLHLLPEAYNRIGLWSVLLILGGFGFMILLEGRGHGKKDHQGRYYTAEMVWAGLILHQVTDGIGLAVASEKMTADWHLALVVLAHRIPVAAVVLWLFRKEGRAVQGWVRIGCMGLATVGGALFADALIPLLSSTAINVFYAFIAGSFLHLMTHDFLDHHAHMARDRHSEFFAFVAGLALLFVAETAIHPTPEAPPADLAASGQVAHSSHVQENSGGSLQHHALVDQFLENLFALVQETAPYLLLGLLVSGLLYAYLPASPVRWLRRGRPLTQSLKGMAFGLPLPICSCGVLPLFLGLSRKGVAPACLVAFLIATPELGIDSFLLSVKLLGWEFSFVRLLVAMVLPVAIALIAVRFLPREPLPDPAAKEAQGDESDGKKESWWHFALVSLVDDIFPFVFFGLFIAALVQSIWPVSDFGQMVGAWDVLLLGALGIPFYVCASASVPFALVLLQHGFSVGAVVVFLFAGPATNVATVLTVNKAFGPGSGLKLATIAFLVAVATGFTINLFYTPDSLDIFDMHDHGTSVFKAVCALLIVLLGAASLYRSGPLHWISTVVAMIPGAIHHPPAEKEKCH